MTYYCAVCGSPLEIVYDYRSIAERLSKNVIKKREWTMWRYRELLPLEDLSRIVSLDEGGTPLLRSKRLADKLRLKNLYLKDETRNPTWSFKDRGSSVGVSKALEIGAKAVGCVSSGNMAASVAAYAARAGVKCFVLVPSEAPLEKLVQMLIYGANTFSVGAPYAEICKVGLGTSRGYGLYWIHNDAPMRIEGQKTSSMEIWEQLGWKVPDKIIVPTSSGGNLSAHWKAWTELHSMGFIEDLPSMVAVQAEGCCPIVRAFRQKRENIEHFGEPKTKVSSISNPDPPSGKRVLKILQKSCGMAAAVSDEAMLNAQELLARTEGIFAEPAAAAPIASLEELLRTGFVDKDETIVCVITGAGLKDTKSAAETCGKPYQLNSLGEYSQLVRDLLD